MSARLAPAEAWILRRSSPSRWSTWARKRRPSRTSTRRSSFRGATRVGVTAQFLEQRRAIPPQLFRYRVLEFPARQCARCGRQSRRRRAESSTSDRDRATRSSRWPTASRNAEIVATDISPQLLIILRDFLRKRPDGAAAFRAGLRRCDGRSVPAGGGRSRPSALRSCTIFLSRSRVLASCFRRSRARRLGDLLRAIRGGQYAAQVHLPEASSPRHPAPKGRLPGSPSSSA